jgi:hypothetical protein
MGLRDGGQLLIEHAGEGEQIVTLVLQRDAHRTDASHIFGFALRQQLNDEIKQLLPGGQNWPGQRQNVMAQPLGERPNVAGQTRRLRLGLSCQLQLGGKRVVWTTPASTVDLGLQPLAP